MKKAIILILTFAAVILLLLFHLRRQLREKHDICEAVFRYQLDNYASEIPTAFLLRVEEKEPPEEFFKRFKGHPLPVMTYSKFSIARSIPEHIYENSSITLKVEKVERISDREAKVEGEIYIAPLNATGWEYKLEKQNGRWIVKSAVCVWIS